MPSEHTDPDEIRSRIIGLGDRSVHKSYYPVLRDRLSELERFRALLDQTHDALCLLALPEGLVIDVNRSLCQWLGYGRDELLAMTLQDLVPPDELIRIREILAGSPENPVSGMFLTRLMGKGGGIVSVEMTVSPVSFGREDFIVAVARDVTERERMDEAMRESEMQYRITIDTINQPILVVNCWLSVVVYNRAFARFVGSQGGSCVTGDSLADCLPSLGSDLAGFSAGVIATGLPAKVRFQAQDSGEERIYEVIMRPVCENGTVRQVVAIIRDLTEEQRTEDLKRRAFEQIEHNMEQFAVLNDHIRNPLQAIVGVADLEGGAASEQIIRSAMEIDRIVRQLDRGWIESEKVREVLLKYYAIQAPRRKAQDLLDERMGGSP